MLTVFFRCWTPGKFKLVLFQVGVRLHFDGGRFYQTLVLDDCEDDGTRPLRVIQMYGLESVTANVN